MAGTTVQQMRPAEHEELAAVAVTLPAKGRHAGAVVEVRLRSHVTEIGTLELEAVPTKALQADERFKVELSLRNNATDQ